MNESNLRESIKIIVDSFVPNNVNSNLNLNNNNSQINENTQGDKNKKRNKQQNFKSEEKKIESHDLIQKCLKEVVSLYRTSAFIEIIIFLSLEVILITYYINEVDVFEAFKVNQMIKKRLDHNIEIIENYRNIDYTRAETILRDMINLKRVSKDLENKIAVFIENSIKKVDPKKCEKKTFDLYFENIYSHINCYPFYNDDTKLKRSFILDENYKTLEVKRLSKTILSKNLRGFTIEIFILENYLTRFKINVEINPTGKINIMDDLYSFNIRAKKDKNRIYLFSVLGFYLLYYGYETIHDILSGDYLSTQRLIIELLDLLSFYFLLIAIFNLYLFTFKNKKNFEPFLNGFANKSSIEIKENIEKCITSYKLFSENYSIFCIISVFRLFKYSIIFRPFEIIVKSIKTICFNIYQFSLFYAILFISFILFGMCAFGSKISEFSTFQKASISLVGIIFGELKFELFYKYHNTIGIIYFCLYVITVVIILFNILSVVITESYRSIKLYMKSESQRLNVIPDCYFIRRNFYFLVKIKFNYYNQEMKNILEGIVMLKTANRVLTSMEVDHDLESLGYKPDVLNKVLKKYGFKSKNIEWNKTQMDTLRAKVDKERKHLNDLFMINMKHNRQIFEKKYKLENSRNLFISRERYLNLDRKVKNLKRLLSIIKIKSDNISHYVHDSIQEKIQKIEKYKK